MTDQWVRPAHPSDAQTIATLLVDEWLMSPLPGVTRLAAALDRTAVAATWADAAAQPPSPRHLLLVACDADTPVGVLAAAPLEEGATARDSEILELVVSPTHRRRGHASRLLAAWADLAAQRGFSGGLAWVRAADDTARSFLAGSGWAPDGALRSLDPTGDGLELLRQVRLVTSLREATAAPDR